MKYPIISTVLALGLCTPALAADTPPLGDNAPSRDRPATSLSGQGSANASGESGQMGAQGHGQATTPAGQGSARSQASVSGDPDAGISPEQARLNQLDGNVRDSMMNRPGAAKQIEQLDAGGFARFDADDSGGIARAEAGNDPFVANAMAAYDVDGNNELSEEEFGQMTQGLQDELEARNQAADDRAENGDPEMRTAFERIDRNDDQVLAAHEADSGSGLAESFGETDENSDGFISEAEFARFSEDRGSSLERGE